MIFLLWIFTFSLTVFVLEVATRKLGYYFGGIALWVCLISLCFILANLAVEDALMEQQYKENLNSVYRELNL